MLQQHKKLDFPESYTGAIAGHKITHSVLLEPLQRVLEQIAKLVHRKHRKCGGARVKVLGRHYTHTLRTDPLIERLEVEVHA